MTDDQTIFRPGKYNCPFTILPNAPVNDPEMSFAAKAILWYLISKPADWKVNQRDVENSSPAGQHVVRNAVNELIEKGYIERFRKKRDDGTFEWVHYVYPLPEYNPKRESPDESIEGFSSAGPSTRGSATSGESQLLLSNEEQTTDEQKNEEQTRLFETQDSEPEEKPKTRNKHDYSREFEEIWAIYPNGKGKLKAFDAFKARVAVGHDPAKLKKAAENYARVCKRQQKEQRFILHGSTFFGPHEEFRDYLDANDSMDRQDIVDTEREGGGYVDIRDIKRPT